MVEKGEFNEVRSKWDPLNGTNENKSIKTNKIKIKIKIKKLIIVSFEHPTKIH